MHICENDHFICNNLVIYHLCNERAEIHTFRTMTRKNRKYSKCALRCSKNEAIYHLISIFFNQITYIHSLYLLSLHYKETCIILQIYKTYKNYQILVKVDLFIDAKKKKKKKRKTSINGCTRNYIIINSTATLLKVWSSPPVLKRRQRRRGSSFEKLADDIHWTILPSLRQNEHYSEQAR